MDEAETLHNYMLMILASTKFVFFIVLVPLLWLLWQLKVSIDSKEEKQKIAISAFSLEIFEFCFYVNVC